MPGTQQDSIGPPPLTPRAVPVPGAGRGAALLAVGARPPPLAVPQEQRSGTGTPFEDIDNALLLMQSFTASPRADTTQPAAALSPLRFPAGNHG